MKGLFTCLLVFGVLAGLNLRGLAASPVCAAEVSHHCESGHEHAPTDDHHHGESDENCPLEHHHHHGCCSHILPMSLGNDAACRIAIPASSLLGVRRDCAVPPDEPLLATAKPPLI